MDRGPDRGGDHAVGREPEETLANAVGLAMAAERAGVDSLWVSDAIRTGGGETLVDGAETDRNGWRYEAYSLLGALAVHTGVLSLGALPQGVEARAPSV